MTWDHLHLLNLKLWVTRIEACFERLWIPRFRSLKLYSCWMTELILLLLWGWQLLHGEFPSYPDGDQEPRSRDVLFQLLYFSLEAPFLFYVPRTGGWVEEGEVGHQDPRCPGKFPRGLGSTPQADSLQFEESDPYFQAWPSGFSPRPHLSHYLFMGLSFLEPLDLSSPAPTTISFHFLYTLHLLHSTMSVFLSMKKNLTQENLGFCSRWLFCGRVYFTLSNDTSPGGELPPFL